MNTHLKTAHLKPGLRSESSHKEPVGLSNQDRIQTLSNAGENTVVLAGALRSGTTLFRLMLGGHSALNPNDEHDYLSDVLNKDGSEPTPEVLAERLKTHRVFQSHNIFIERGSDYQNLLAQTLTPLRRNGGMPVISLHRNFESMLPYFSDAKFIHLLRDPRDVANSSVDMGWNGNVYRGVDHWIETERSWQEAARHLRPDQMLTVKYETLVENPEATLREITDFLGLEFESRMLTSYTETSTYKPIDPSRSGRWRKLISARDLAHLEGKLERHLADAGYSPVTTGRLKRPGPVTEFALDLHDRLGRNSAFIRRYSVGLVVSEKFSRWFGLTRWNASVRHRMNIIENTHIV